MIYNVQCIVTIIHWDKNCVVTFDLSSGTNIDLRGVVCVVMFETSTVKFDAYK